MIANASTDILNSEVGYMLLLSLVLSPVLFVGWLIQKGRK